MDGSDFYYRFVCLYWIHNLQTADPKLWCLRWSHQDDGDQNNLASNFGACKKTIGCSIQSTFFLSRGGHVGQRAQTSLELKCMGTSSREQKKTFLPLRTQFGRHVVKAYSFSNRHANSFWRGGSQSWTIQRRVDLAMFFQASCFEGFLPCSSGIKVAQYSFQHLHLDGSL